MITQLPYPQDTTSPKPISDSDPLNEWCASSCNFDVFSPECFFDGKATLITGRMDMFPLALLLVNAWNDGHKDLPSPWRRPAYIKGDAYPSACQFLSTLQASKLQLGIVVKVRAVMKPQFQDFPLNIYDNPDSRKVIFRWVVVNQEMPPWDHQGTRFSRLEKTLEAAKQKPLLIVLDGFSWNGSMVELKNVLSRMKKQKISVIVFASKQPPNDFANHSIWDNLVRVRPWRNWRCSACNIVLNFFKRNGVKTNIRHHLVSKDEIFWQEKPDGYNFLRPLVAGWMRNGKTAAEIVAMINSNLNLSTNMRRPLTVPTLARLKREWGLRTYKPERKPRKPKQTKKDYPAASPPSEEQI